MKRLLLILSVLGLSVQWATAQDDLYFTPTKDPEPIQKKEVSENQPYRHHVYRDVDEYNRAGKYRSHYQKIDGSANDIITMEGVGADTSYVDTTFYGPEADWGDYYDDSDDFRYSRMIDFDWWGWPNYWSYTYMYSPYWWTYDFNYWGDPWMAGYWYWDWPYYGFYPRWGYFDRYGWGWPYYWGGPYYTYWDWGGPGYYYNNGGGNFRYGATGTRNHGGWSGRATAANSSRSRSGNFSGYRGRSNSRSFGNNSTSFGSSSRRSSPRANYPTRSNSSFGTSSRGSSFGSGSRGGSFGGGSRGGSFGGGGSRGGGVHMGGRR
ncbi:MAG: hypothetical protein ACOYJG_09025 [Prevotella sp.]|jgi:hypothetical protein